tara:strand:- start:242 stop:388 length:147 start_codon:yes stop_codon:yes gene_type:complete
MSKLPKRKLINKVMDAAVAAALILLVEGEKMVQTIKNKGERFLEGEDT